jgi:hypothetical protein
MAVVDQFISAFLDDKFFGSERDPHCYTQTVMRGIMSEEGLENIDEGVEDITKLVDWCGQISLWCRARHGSC